MKMLEGKGAPGRFQLYIDGKLVGETDVPYTTPMILNPGAVTVAPTRALPSRSTTPARLCSPAPSTPSPST